jgi:D-alanyl-D-alanine carboxypeptidase (penicillin-binding protein 5/6)
MQAWRSFYFFSKLILVIFLCIGIYENSMAAAKKRYAKAIIKPSYSALVVDASSNKILFDKNATATVNPASLTKMMTTYLAFESIKKNQFSMESKLPISKYAASRPRTNMGLRAGQTITMKEAILAMIVKSANDASVVIGEAIAGSEEKFAQLMNSRARQLGMKNTTFTNASGWHHPSQKTTALDMAKLAIALRRDFKENYYLFSRTSFTYKNRIFKGHNHVLTKLQGAEGMKTGYTSKAGYNLVTTASRGNTRLVGVIIGGSSWQSRDNKMIAMLNSHFHKIDSIKNKRNVYASTNSKRSSKIASIRQNSKTA